MLSGDENETKPVRKPRKARAEQDGKKAEPRKRKAAARAEPAAEQLLEAAQVINASVASTESGLTDSAQVPASSESSPDVSVAPAETDDQRQNPQAEQVFEAAETISTSVATIENIQVESPASEVRSALPVVAAEAVPVSYQTIAEAYRRYTTESLDRTQTFFGRLAGVRSLDMAFALQTEFAKQAYEGFVAESRRIRELHGQLAKERLKQWEGFVAHMMSPR
jgi:hypothetical protein